MSNVEAGTFAKSSANEWILSQVSSDCLQNPRFLICCELSGFEEAESEHGSVDEQAMITSFKMFPFKFLNELRCILTALTAKALKVFRGMSDSVLEFSAELSF